MTFIEAIEIVQDESHNRRHFAACEVLSSFIERWEDATKELGGEGVIASFMKQMEGDEKDK